MKSLYPAIKEYVGRLCESKVEGLFVMVPGSSFPDVTNLLALPKWKACIYGKLI
jgi:hypothetical protein